MRILTVLFCTLAPLLCISQPVLERRNEIPVSEHSVSLINAWAGGLNNPQFSAIDLNRDGKSDWVVFDRADNSLLTFINTGSWLNPRFQYAPQYIDSFPEASLYGWVALRDFNGDGEPDIWTADQNSNVRVFKNTRGQTGQLSFQSYTDPIYSNYPPNLILYSASNDYPGIIDVDGDGDLDFLTFDVLGGSVEFHKNLSIENGWGLDSLRFTLQSFCFGHFHESGLTCTAFLNDAPCGTGMRVTAHSGSTLLPLDLDANNLVDLVIGDISCDYFYALRNHGTSSVAHMDSLENYYPNVFPTHIPAFPAGFYLDADNDQVRDLVAAPNLVGDCENKQGVWWYHNAGTDNAPDFQFRDSALLQGTMVEVGSGAAPAFFDFDGDSLQDLMVGNLWYYTAPPANKTAMALYRNIGTAQVPEYVLWSNDFLNLSSNPSFSSLDYFTPAFADLDNDGDQDLYFGEQAGGINYFENIANPGDTANYVFVSANFQNIYAGTNPAPVFHDLDLDGDKDLVIGNRRGLLTYYENQGSVTNPNFVKITDSLGTVVIGSQFIDGYSKPCFINWDADPQSELIVGRYDGKINVYDNLSATAGAVFSLIDSFPADYGSMAAPTAAVIDTSGNTTFVIGNQRGGLQMLGKAIYVPVSESKGVHAHPLNIWPNPSNEGFRIDFGSLQSRQLELRLFSMDGRQLMSKTVERGEIISTRELPSGAYWLGLSGENERVSGKLIVVHP